jgi:hypothetical protein
MAAFFTLTCSLRAGLGVTFFGLAFTPVFYVISTGLSELRFRWRKPEVPPAFTPEGS